MWNRKSSSELNKVLEYKGYWWLPKSPDDQVAGSLTIEPDGKMKLELYGGFGNENDDAMYFFEPKIEPVIFGRCYAPNSNMKDISLFTCGGAVRFNLGSTFIMTSYSCHYGLIGIHVESMNTPAFFKAQVDYDDLVYWCPSNNIKTSLNENHISLDVDISHRDVVPLSSVEFNDGLTLNLMDGVTFSISYPKMSFEQGTFIEIIKDEISAKDILSVVRNFERFFTVATLVVQEHCRIMLQSKREFQEFDNGEIRYHSIELIVPLYENGKKVENRSHEFLFRYADVAKDFENIYSKYCGDKSINQIWNNLIYSLERNRVFTSNDFLVVVQALDGFAIRYRKYHGLLNELKGLRDEFYGVKGINQLTDDDLLAAKGSRHYYSHILKMEEKESKHAVEGSELLNITRKLRLLLICCVLSFLGMDVERINELVSKCNNKMVGLG